MAHGEFMHLDIPTKLPELGGAVVVAKTEIPGMGWYAAINDSEGNEIGIFERQTG